MWGACETSPGHRWCLVWASLADRRRCPELCVQTCFLLHLWGELRDEAEAAQRVPGCERGMMRAPSLVWISGVGVNTSGASWCWQEGCDAQAALQPVLCKLQTQGSPSLGSCPAWPEPSSLYPSLSKSSWVSRDPHSGLTESPPPALRQPHHMV